MMNNQSEEEKAAISISSPSFLLELLRSHIPSETLSSWGVASGTKTLQNLWIEIAQGESSIVTSNSSTNGSGILRVVNVATLNVKNAASGAVLMESQQLLSDGTIRTRNRPLSEKMKPGESIHDAAPRALREELGENVKARILMETYKVNVDEEKSSNSYPGLPARYVLHSVDAIIEEGIPKEGEFWTEEHGEEKDAADDGQARSVRKHFWKWV